MTSTAVIATPNYNTARTFTHLQGDDWRFEWQNDGARHLDVRYDQPSRKWFVVGDASGRGYSILQRLIREYKIY